jgi:hypothetical protein
MFFSICYVKYHMSLYVCVFGNAPFATGASLAVSTGTIFFTYKHKNIPLPLKKGTFEGLAGAALSRGRDIPGH